MAYAALFDESGDEGFDFREPHAKGSSEWFILAAALQIGYNTTDDIREQYAEFKQRYRRQDNWTFHFVKASHHERLGFIHHMRSAPYKLFSVAIHKPSLRKPENFRKPYFMYFYAAKLLLERVTAYVRDASPQVDWGRNVASMAFSSRRGLLKENIVEYLELLQLRSDRDDYFSRLSNHNIHWPSLSLEKIDCVDNGEMIGLQMADLFASSVAQALEYSPHSLTECRYLRSLKPMIYNRDGNYIGYGLKLFPDPSTAMLAEDRFSWRQHFVD